MCQISTQVAPSWGWDFIIHYTNDQSAFLPCPVESLGDEKGKQLMYGHTEFIRNLILKPIHTY